MLLLYLDDFIDLREGGEKEEREREGELRDE